MRTVGHETTMKHVTQWPPIKAPHQDWNLFHLFILQFLDK